MATTSFQILSSTRVTQRGGMLHRCQHASSSTHCDMIFSVFLPHSYNSNNNTAIPSVYYLSGLTCTDENFCQKAGAFLPADELGLALIVPDTSPRNRPEESTVSVPDDPDKSYDLGHGAGFYLNATQEPWKHHYQMETYIQDELPALVAQQWPGLDDSRRSILGHSMGGHGALTLVFKSLLKNSNQQVWTSVSALAPICHPSHNCPWGEKAFTNYLGSVESGKNHDATELLRQLLQNSTATTISPLDDILIDQGLQDQFLSTQLGLDDFEAVANQVGQKVTIRRHPGMDHSYYFIAACIRDHLEFHAQRLKTKE